MTVLVGDPIHFDDLLNAEGIENISRGKLYDAVASRIGHRLHELKVKVEKLAFEHLIKLQHSTVGSAERAADMVQQIDGDSFGMGSHVFAEDVTLKYDIPSTRNVTYHQEPTASDCYFRMGCSNEGGIISRMHGYMDSTELLGFAARGLFMNQKSKENTPIFREVGPLRAWKQFMEANLLQQWNSC